MNKIVVKIGGSNLKTKNDINKIVKLIKSYNSPLIIVVSAVYGVTDLLEKLIANPEKSDLLINTIINKYIDIFIETNTDVFNEKKQELKFLVKQLIENQNSIETQNNILIFGEKLTVLALSNVLNINKVVNKLAFPENFNLFTTNKLKSAIIHKDLNKEKIGNFFSSSTNYIVPGFYGITKNNQIALFGRGGSDYTAAILANILDAKSLDLWKDVSGFLSADPKLVEKVQKIDSLTYLEAAELSYFGAKIIHPGTIRPLLQKQIPLNILSFNNNNLFGTKIIYKEKSETQTIKSITYSKNFVLLKLKGSGVGIKKGILKEITSLFDKNDINIRSVITSQIEIDFLLNISDLELAKKLIESINQNTFDLEIDTDIALIAAVGSGIKQSAGIAGQIFGALAKAEINVKHIVFGASDVAIYLIVAQKDLKTAINQIHQSLFKNL